MLRIILIVTLTILVVCRAQFEQIQKPGKNDVCAAFCDGNYKQQTNATEACKQGCSLFSLLQLTGESPNPDEKLIGEECGKSCEQSYSDDKELKSACSAGCRNQTVKVGSILIDMDSSSPFINKISDITDRIFSPAREMFREMSSKFGTAMSSFRDKMSSWMPESVVDEDQEDRIGRNFLSKLLKGVQQSVNFDNPQDFEQGEFLPSTAAPTVGNSDENGEPVVVVHMVPLKAIEPQDFFFNENSAEDSFLSKQEDTTLQKDSPVIAFEPSPPVVQISSFEEDDDWLACVGRRIRHLSMLTRWMLCLAMILSVAGMIWICMAILRTKPRRRLMYISQKSCSKGGVDNVYYTIPPYSSATATPVDVKSGLESPPTYESVVSDEKKNPITA